MLFYQSCRVRRPTPAIEIAAKGLRATPVSAGGTSQSAFADWDEYRLPVK